MNTKLSGKGVVILIDSGAMYIEAATLGKRRRSKNRIIVKLAPGAVEDGIIRDVPGVAELLRDALRENRLTSIHQAVFCLCSSQILTESAVVPEVESKWLGKMLDTNRDIYFPVDTREYELTYRQTGKGEDESGKPTLYVDIWATPKEMLRGYYQVANECGLFVAAIDYCGESFLNAAAAVYKGTDKELSGFTITEEEATALEHGQEDDTWLFLQAETDFLLMTFIRNQKSVMQRYLRRGGMITGELEEARLTMEMYMAEKGVSADSLHLALFGGDSAGGGYASVVRDALGMDIKTVGSGDNNSIWFLCGGASGTSLDFGDPAMNSLQRFSLGSQVVKYVVLAASAGAVIAGAFACIYPSAAREAEIRKLQTTLSTREFKLSEVAGFQAHYNEYASAYDGYLEDWETILGMHTEAPDANGNPQRVYVPGVLRSYNDNLKLVLDELDSVMPANSKVTSIRAENGALALQFSSVAKQDVIDLLVTLRYKLKYTQLYSDYIPPLQLGQGVPVTDSSVTAALSAILTPQVGTFDGQASDSGESGATEMPSEEDLLNMIPPTEGSAGNTSTKDAKSPKTVDEKIVPLEDVLSDLTKEQQEVIRPMIDRGPDTEYTVDEMGVVAQAVADMTPARRRVLAEAMGWNRDCKYTLEELLSRSDVTFAVKQTALKDMLKNPVAVAVFAQAAQADMQSGEKSVLALPFGDDVVGLMLDGKLDSGTYDLLLNGDPEKNMDAFKQLYPLVSNAPVKDKENVNASVELIRQNEELGIYYASYLNDLFISDDPLPTEGPTPTDAPNNPGSSSSTDNLMSMVRLLLAAEGIDVNQVRWDELDWSAVNLNDPAQAAKDILQQIRKQMNGETGSSNNNGTGMLPGFLTDLFQSSMGNSNPLLDQDPAVTQDPAVNGETPAEQEAPALYYTTVILIYKQDVFSNELNRQGLYPDAFVPKLEVKK